MTVLLQRLLADRAVRWAAVAVAACAVVPFTPLPDFYVQQAYTLFFYISLALSWNILGGYTGYLSLGHASFVGIGGYAVGCLYFLAGLSPFVTFPVAMLAAGLLALLIGVICFRVRGSYFLIATMLVLFILQTLAANLSGLTNGADGIDLPIFTADFAAEARVWFYLSLLICVLVATIAYGIEHSALGLNLMAIREDEDVARSMGVRVVRCKAIAFVSSAALAGLLGAFDAYRAHIIEPFSAFSVQLSAAPILMATLGGSRTWVGPILGAAIFDVVSTTLTLTVGGEYSDMLFALFLIGVVLLLPEGLLGLARRLRARAARRDGIPAVPARSAR